MLFFNRPPQIALCCVALWLLQWVLFGVVYRFNGGGLQAGLSGLSGWDIAWLATSLSLGVVLMLQLPRALRWLPRRSRRPSAQLRAERERIARDLHDRLGAQLVNAMALLDADHPLQHTALKVLDQSVLDLRLIVDAMAVDEGEPLLQRLARLRHRFQPALERRGVQLGWDLQLPDDVPLPVGAVASDILAVVQEALSNVLQHANATEATVRVAYRHGHALWMFCVEDNGTARPAPAAAGREALAWPQGSAGQGIQGMHARAQRAGGRLHWEPMPAGGVRVRLEIRATPVV